MLNLNTSKTAKEIALKYHANEMHGQKTLISHLEHTVKRLCIWKNKSYFNVTEDEIVAAWLHHFLDCAEWAKQERQKLLIKKFSEEIINAIKLLSITERTQENKAAIKQNKIALNVMRAQSMSLLYSDSFISYWDRKYRDDMNGHYVFCDRFDERLYERYKEIDGYSIMDLTK
jgi:hypothetical protein